MLNFRLNLDGSMKLFYTIDCCLRVLVCGFILPLKVVFLTFGWRPIWVRHCVIWIKRAMVAIGLANPIMDNELSKTDDGHDCFIMDCIEYFLNNGVVVFVLLEYTVRYAFHKFS